MADDLKKPFHEQVAQKLIEQLNQGTAPWQRPWEPGTPGSHTPMNPITGKRYRGINTIQLMAQDRTDQRWMTYKQAAAVGAQVRKGEKGTPIQYWKFAQEQTRTDDKGRPVLDAKGDPITEQVKLERPRVFFATVFNAEQIDSLPALQKKEHGWNALERAETILNASGVTIRHGESSRAFYRPATDSIHLPDKAQFATADKYYATALHELGHSTGHESRLDRDLSHPFGSAGYAKEELRAEIASMVLGDELGIGHDPGQHAAYVGLWIKALQDDPLEIFRAAAEGEKIRDFVLGLEHEQVQQQTRQQGASMRFGDQRNERQQSNGQALAALIGIVLNDPATDYSHFTSHQGESLGGALRAHGFDTVRDAVGTDEGKFNERAIEALSPVFAIEPADGSMSNAYLERQGLAQSFSAAAERLVMEQQPQPTDEMTRGDARVAGARLDLFTGNARQQRQYLAVPFGEHQVARAAGALWDKAAKCWYAGPKADTDKLQRWLSDNTAAQQGPARSPLDEFAEALRSLGCVVAGRHPVMDGKKQRITVEGDKKGEQAGLYVGHLDGHPAGYIKNYRTGIEMKWKSNGYSLDPEQKAQLAAEAAIKRQARAAEQEQLHERVAQRVKEQMAGLVPVEQPTAYMQAKGIAPQPGVYTDREAKKTYIPGTDVHGKQWTLQYIQHDGTKRFAKDSRKEGCLHAIGGLDAIAKAPAIVIAEGYATAASLKQGLGFGTVAAFDAGNLPHVAKALHEKYPHKPIVIAGDDDRQLEATQGINPGRTKADEAARAVGGVSMLPIFAPGELDQGLTDFNDLATRSELGQKALVQQAGAAVGKAIAMQQESRETPRPARIEGPLQRAADEPLPSGPCAAAGYRENREREAAPPQEAPDAGARDNRNAAEAAPPTRSTHMATSPTAPCPANTIEATARHERDPVDAETEKLRARALTGAGAAATATAPAQRDTAERRAAKHQVIARMNREQLVAHIDAQQAGSEHVEASLQRARERIEAQVQRGGGWQGTTALADRFNVVRHLHKNEYQFRNRPGQVAFTERWLSMQSDSDTPAVVRAMVERAHERGWSAMRVSGAAEFARQAWIAAEARGIKAVGYTPSQGDRIAAREEYARLNPQQPEKQGADQAPACTPQQQAAGSTIERTKTRERTPAPDRTGHEAEVMLALEKAMVEKKVPASQRELVREEAARTLHELRARGQSARPRRSEQPRAFVGELIEHGPARHRFDAQEEQSYFVTLKDQRGRQKTLWGVELKEALADSSASIGQTIELKVTGKKPVTVQGNVRDAEGRVVGRQHLVSRRNQWQATVVAAPTRTRAQPELAR